MPRQVLTQDELRAFSRQPNVWRMLDTLAWGEGADYNTLVGGGTFDDFSRHPRKSVRIKRLGLNSTAAGRYQFLNSTWNEVARRHGLTDFSPESQDMAAVARLAQRGLLDDVTAGNWDRVLANPELGREWASMPGSPHGQGTRSREETLARLQGHQGKTPQGSPDLFAPLPDIGLFDNPLAGEAVPFQLGGQRAWALSGAEQDQELLAAVAQETDEKLRGALLPLGPALDRAEKGRQGDALMSPWPTHYDDRLLKMIDEIEV